MNKQEFNRPNENSRVRIDFYYAGELVTGCPAEYRDGEFIVAFYSSEVPIDPVA